MTSEHEQDVFSPAANEALAQGGKAVALLRMALEMTERRLRVAADAENLVSAAQRQEALARQRAEATDAEAARLIRDATAQAEQIVGAANTDAARKRDEVTLLAGEEAQVTGRVNELRAEERRLVERIKVLATKVGALEAVEPSR